MSMLKSEMRDKLKKLLRSVCDNVEETFVFPEEKAQMQNAFPYITVIFGDMTFQENSARYTQKISILGFVKGTETDIISKQDALESKIFQALHKNEQLQLVITGGSNSNLFKPFGFDAGVFLPYAGIRFELEIPQVKVL